MLYLPFLLTLWPLWPILPVLRSGLELIQQRQRFGARLFKHDASLQTSDDCPVIPFILAGRVDAHRQDDVPWSIVLKFGRQNTDDRVERPIEIDLGADYPGVRSEAPPP